MNNLNIKMAKGEYWYGGHINYGFMMPMNKWKFFKVNLNRVSSYNQANTLFISNQGRIIFCDKGFAVTFCFGKIKCLSTDAEIKFFEAEEKTLRGAFKLASKIFMPPDGKYPNEMMFTVPQYCTWIQLDNNQSQTGILNYAKSILECGMPAGELIIDDGWQTTFGEWKFINERFSDPKGMIKELKDLGFKVIMWIAPFVSEKAKDFEFLKNENLLVKDFEGKVAFRTWWNGKDALLDFSNPKAVAWFFEQTDYLTNELGVDGFKQDGGDPMYYEDDDVTFGNVSANDQCELWAKSSIRYDYNELRACFKCGGMGVAQRIADKSHHWNVLGLGALIPNVLIQGLMGYPYTCPDMIGGGQMGDFRGKAPESFDHELFARYCQTSALMPMMQYSLNIWDLGNATTKKVCQEMSKLHTDMAEYIMKYVKHASVMGEPIVRFMEYNYPNCGYAKVKTQFMLGDDYIVAPVLKKKARSKKVYIPDGKWQYKNKTYMSQQVVEIECALDELIVLKKV